MLTTKKCQQKTSNWWRLLCESISGKKLCKAIEKLGWTLVRVKGSHHIYTKEDISKIIVIPVHGNRNLPTGILKGILKDAELTEDDI